MDQKYLILLIQILGTSEEQDQVVNHILTPLGIREENDQVVGQMPTPGGIREEQYQVVGYIPSPLGIREEQDQVVSYIPSPLGIREENDQVVGHMLLQEGLESGSWLYTFYTREEQDQVVSTLHTYLLQDGLEISVPTHLEEQEQVYGYTFSTYEIKEVKDQVVDCIPSLGNNGIQF